MVELASVLLLCVGLAAATPHGYGVKGGALAKADASAVAGAFAGVPQSVPSGADYSGSYSKSSSSSFASSSASSSSSAFSGTFSGSEPHKGANGLTGVNGVSGTNGGCSGGCSPSGDSGSSDIHGASNSGAFSGSKAAAIAGAVAGAGSSAYDKNKVPCVGGSCSDTASDCEGSSCYLSSNSDICAHGNCRPSPTAATSNGHEPTKCTSGKCDANYGTPTASYNSNDIPVNVNSDSEPKSSYNSNSQSTYSSTGSNSASDSVSKPSTHLTAPKEGQPCTSGNCHSNSDGAYDYKKPSSYNVPIHGPHTTSSTQKNNPCTSGNCGTDDVSLPAFVPLGPTKPTNCASGNCANYPQNQQPTGPSSIQKPTDYPTNLQTNTLSPAQASHPFYKPSYTQTSCGTPNCIPANPPTQVNVAVPSPVSSYPSYSQSGTVANPEATAGANAGAHSVTRPIKDKQPYTGGFGGPAGFLKPNDFIAPTNVPVHHSKPLSPISTSAPNALPCSSESCGPNPQYDQNPSHYQPTGSTGFYNPTVSTGSYSPTVCSSGNCAPKPAPSPQPVHTPSKPAIVPTSPTSGFGGPPGILKPNEYQTPTNIPSVYKPITPIGPSPASCTSGNCGQPSSHYNPTGFAKPSSHLNPPVSNYIPSTAATLYNPSSDSSPYNDHSSIPSNNQNKPIIPTLAGSTPCTTGACSNFPRPTSTSGSSGPCPSGNCGFPSSNIPHVPSTPQTSFHQPISSTSSYAQSDATSGSHYNPTTTTGSGSYPSPTPCVAGNCGPQPSQPSSISTSPSGSLPAAYNPSSCATGQCGSTGNFVSGGALQGSYRPTPCTSGQCGSTGNIAPQLGHNAASSGTSPGGYNPIPCSSGQCGSTGNSATQQNHAIAASGVHSFAGAASSANAVAYTGGFGGPPGLLKPYDSGKLDNAGLSALSPGKYSVGPQGAINHGSYGGASIKSQYGNSLNGESGPTGAVAQAVAGASAGAFGGINGANQAGGYSSPHNGCSGGCGSDNDGLNGANGSINGFGLAGASAKSVATADAGAGSYGAARSFASSSAVAHASAGAATKGGYGRR